MNPLTIAALIAAVNQTVVDPFAGFTRLSSLLPGLGLGGPLSLSPGVSLLVDVQMQDSDRMGQLNLAPGSVLRFDPRVNTRLLVAGIGNSGDFQAGTATAAHPMQAIIDLCGAIPTVSGNSGGGPLVRGPTHDINTQAPTGNNGGTNDNGGMSRGFMNNPGGVLKLFGQRAPVASRLNNHYVSGTVLEVADFITAPAGSTVLVSPSGFFSAATRTEVRTLAVAAVNTKFITIDTPLGYARWGVTQWYTDNGISLTQGPFTLYNATTNPTGMRTLASQNAEIDQRAFVCVIAPTIKLRGYDAGNSSLATDGFGFHGMSMGLTSTTVLKNIGAENYGQLGLLGRYAWHFHMPSYVSTTGAYRTDGVAGSAPYTQVGVGTANYPAGAALIDGMTGLGGQNRFLVLHGCRGVKLTNCIGHAAAGHAILEEDGSEEENEISNCLAFSPRDAGPTRRLKDHESSPFGFWFSNMWNTHTNNWGVDTPGGPWWNALSVGKVSSSSQFGCLGASSLVPIAPAYSRMGVWDGNSGLSCGNYARSDNATDNDAGVQSAAQARRIAITTNGIAFGGYSAANEVVQGFALQNARLYKLFGYSNQVSSSNYTNWRISDVLDMGIQGNANFGLSDGMLGIRESLNHEGNFLNAYGTILFATYHGLLSHTNVTADGFTGGAATTGGGNHGALQRRSVISSWESYTDPIHYFSANNSGWRLRNSRGMWQVPPWHLVQGSTTYDAYTGTAAGWPKNMLTGVGGELRGWSLGIQFDRYGTMGQGPTQAPVPYTHIVWNQPFFTAGAGVTTPLEGNPESVRTTTSYCGLILLYYGAGTGGNFGSGLDETLTPGNFADRRAQYNTRFERVDASRVAIAGAVWEMPDSTGPAGQQILHSQHHAAIPVGGYATLRWPTLAKETKYLWGTINAQSDASNPNGSASDFAYWGIEWANTTPVAGVSFRGGAFTAQASFAALQAGAVNGYWQDTTNNLVWIKVPAYGNGNWKIWATGFA